MQTWNGADAADLRKRVFGLFCNAFGPQDEQRWTEELWERHRSRPNFRLVTALEHDVLLGFGWGYTGLLGQFWADRMATALGPDAATWLGGHFEFVELGVHARSRGRGIGGRVHDAILADLPHARAVLCTSTSPDDPAVRLYRSRGWRTIGRMGEDVQIMGRLLPVA